jgi:hypothetical protein
LASEEKRAWESMRLEAVGHVGDVLKGGGGKLTIMADDTGDEPRKPKGQEGV